MQDNTLGYLISTSKLKTYLIFLGIIIILLSLPLFFARGIGVVDDSNFLIIARWIDYGFKPYNDIVELKPPGIFYLLNILKRVFGEAWWVSRAFMLSVDLLLVFFTIMVMFKWQGWLSGLLGGIFLYPTLLLFGGYRIHTENFCALFGIIALWIIYGKEDRSLVRAFIFGLVIGMSTLFKQPGIFYLAAYLVFLLICILKKKIIYNRGLILSLLSILGFICVWSITIFLLYRGKMLKEFIHYSIIVPLTYPRDIYSRLISLFPIFICTPIPIVFTVYIAMSIKYKDWKLNDFFQGYSLLLALIFLFSLIPLYKRPSPHYIICSLFSGMMLSAHIWHKIINLFLKNIKSYFKKNISKIHRLFIILFVILPILPSVLAVTCMSYFFIREQRLKIDCLQTYEIGSKVVQYCPDFSEPILGISPNLDPCSRIYYMLERRPLFKDATMTFESREVQIKLKEVLECIKSGIVPIVILEHPMKVGSFALISIDELHHILEKNYKRVPLQFAIDPSREKKIELHVLNNLKPAKREFQSRIFPRGCVKKNYF